MRLLLTTLNSKYVHSSPALKCLYLAAEDLIADIEIEEFTINNSRDHIFTQLIRGNHDVICFSCYIWNIEMITGLCEDLKKADSDLTIILGGPEVSFGSREFMKEHKNIDFIIPGEGEETFRDLIMALDRPGDRKLSQIKGIFYRQKTRVYETPRRDLVDIKELPFPYDTFPCERDKVIYYESSRGCPFSCSYCMSSVDRSIRSLDVARVKRDISYFIYENVKQVKFLDRTFNWDEPRCYEIFRYIMDMDRGKTNFHFELCGDLISKETIRLLKRARKGLFQFEIGIQSTDIGVLKISGRDSDIKKASSNIRELAETGNIGIHLDLIAGLPGDTVEKFKKSFNDVYVLGGDVIQLGFLKLLKGTAVRKEAAGHGYEYMSRPPYEVIANKYMSSRELCKLKGIETVLDLYYNRRGFSKALKYLIEKTGEDAFDFFRQLADFYYDEGYQNKSHKKEDLYRILYKFSLTRVDGSEAQRLLEEDLEQTMNFDAVKKFKRKGWELP